MIREKRDFDETETFFSVESHDALTVLHFKAVGGLLGSSLEQGERLWHLLKDIQTQKRKVLLIRIDPGYLSANNIARFQEEVLGTTAETAERRDGFTPSTEMSFIREEYALCRFVSLMREMRTFVVCAIQGEILLSFLGPILACDYRIVSEDTVIHSRCLETGMPPCGAFLWFLTHYLGQGRASRILYGGEVLSSKTLFDLGLANKIVSSSDLDKEAKATAEFFLSKPTERLVAAKQMMNATHLPLHSYLEIEASEFKRSLSKEY